MRIFIYFLGCVFWLTSSSAQPNSITNDRETGARGFSTATDSTKVQAVPECSAQHMIVHLRFNRTLMTTFDDWIVVGTNSHQACRHQGRGELDYIIEIPIVNDPCGTKMVDRGTFENIIRIGQNPLIILRGDELITVRCFYGPPETITQDRNIQIGNQLANVQPAPGSQFTATGSFENTNQIAGALNNANNNANNNFSPFGGSGSTQNSQTPSYPSGQSVEATEDNAAYAYVFYLVLPILLLALLCMICGCLFALVKRHKVRIERRKQAVATVVPQNNELSKLGLSHLWWNAKSSVSNDALLSHDYMISSNSTREALSVSTDYGPSTPSDRTARSPGHGHDKNNGQQRMPAERDPNYESPMQTPSPGHGHGPKESVSVTHESGHYAHHDVVVDAVDTKPKSYSEWRSELLAASKLSSAASHRSSQDQPDGSQHEKVYTEVDHQNRRPKHHKHFGGAHDDSLESQEAMRRTVASQLRSITEIYASVDRDVRSQQHQDDRSSVSTLEADVGRQYGIGDNAGVEMERPSVVCADVHAAVVRGVIEEKNEWITECLKSVEQQRGFGPRKLSVKEIEKFRQLMCNDGSFSDLMFNSTGIDDFEAVGRRPEFSNVFAPDKWTVIAHSVAHMAFMSRLNTILDTKSNPDTPDAEYGPIDESQSTNNKRRYVKRTENLGAPRRASADELEQAAGRVLSQRGTKHGPAPPQRAGSHLTTTKGTEPGPPEPMKRSGSRSQTSSDVKGAPEGLVDTPSTINVYLGNVPERPLPTAVSDKMTAESLARAGSSLNSAARYAALLESNASCATTYDHSEDR